MGVVEKCLSCGTPLKHDARFCAQCGSPASPSTIETSAVPPAPKAQKYPMSKRAKTIYLLVATGLFAFFLFIFMNHIPGGSHPVIAEQPEVAMASMGTDQSLTLQPIETTVEDGTISFSLITLKQRKFVQFEYQSATGPVPLLAFISPEGKLVTAIRLCEPCNSKTFKIEGDELACGNCETRWKLNNLEGIQGSCQKYPPDPIPSKVVGNRVLIDEAAVKNWKMRI